MTSLDQAFIAVFIMGFLCGMGIMCVISLLARRVND